MRGVKKMDGLRIFKTILVVIFFFVILQSEFYAEGYIPTTDIFKRSDKPDDVVTTLEIVLILTVLTLAPAILILMTSFTRIVIILSFVRRALGTQELPPNQVVIGLSLFLTFMIMSPTFNQMKNSALAPYMEGKITQPEAFNRAIEPLRNFMFSQTRAKDIQLFININKIQLTENPQKKDIPTEILIPAFIISELRRAFIMGFAIFLPFLIIDIVVATALISMGMLVLPPIFISLPLKIVLFVLVDGWHLIVGSIVQSFHEVPI